MKVTVIPSVIGVLRTVTQRLLQELGGLETRGQEETIQTTALLRSASILGPGKWRELAITQTPLKNHQLMLM